MRGSKVLFLLKVVAIAVLYVCYFVGGALLAYTAYHFVTKYW